MIKDIEPLLKECEETLTELESIGEMEGACYVQGFINSINKLPEIERPHGEWIPYTTIDGYTKHATCTNCGYERKVGIGCSLDTDNLPKFCEGCGADMRKEGGEK